MTPWTIAGQAPVFRISQAKILEWVATSFSKQSSWPGDWSCISCLADRYFITLSHLGSLPFPKTVSSGFYADSYFILYTHPRWSESIMAESLWSTDPRAPLRYTLGAHKTKTVFITLLRHYSPLLWCWHLQWSCEKSNSGYTYRTWAQIKAVAANCRSSYYILSCYSLLVNNDASFTKACPWWSNTND